MESIIREAAAHAEKLLTMQLDGTMHFHNWGHTKYVAGQARILGKLANLNPAEMMALEVAGYFHDLGYTRVRLGHEAIGAALAEEFLSERKVEQGLIDSVKSMIAATQMNVVPNGHLEQILCDADASHLASENYSEWSDKLRLELTEACGDQLNEATWLKTNIGFFEGHTYFSPEGKKRFDEGKSKNFKAIVKRYQDMSASQEVHGASEKKKNKKDKKDKKNKDKQGRGVETMFRVTLKNHTALSQIADNKANIMLSINAIIISVVLTSLLPKLDNNTYLLWPSVLLLIVCIISIVFATISTIPKITEGKHDRASVEARKTNLLFFGNFYNMAIDDYTWGMKEMMKDDDYLYESLMKDLYYLGKVLHKKYKYLRICYGVFMLGIILSVLAYLFALSLMFQPPA